MAVLSTGWPTGTRSAINGLVRPCVWCGRALVLHAMPSLACRGLPWVRSVARATDRGSGCFAGAPRRGAAGASRIWRSQVPARGWAKLRYRSIRSWLGVRKRNQKGAGEGGRPEQAKNPERCAWRCCWNLLCCRTESYCKHGQSRW